MQALANSTLEYESLEAEVSALHDELWEQLSLDLQVKGLPGRRGPSFGPRETTASALEISETENRELVLE